jgi:hypothetical protein
MSRGPVSESFFLSHNEGRENKPAASPTSPLSFFTLHVQQTTPLGLANAQHGTKGHRNNKKGKERAGPHTHTVFSTEGQPLSSLCQ